MRAIALLLATLLPLALSTSAMTELAPAHDHGVQAHLTLDNGRKWSADKHTVDSVAVMKSAVGKVSGTTPRPSPAEMHAAGASLQEQLQVLIRGCTMTGASHEQLHAWISALAPQIEKLQKSERPEDGYAAVDEISGLLRAFDDHFQVSR